MQRLDDNIKNAKEDWLQRPETIQITKTSTEQKITWKQKLEENQLYGHFKRQTSEISQENLDMAKKRDPKVRN